jgi:hypothetical protein
VLLCWRKVWLNKWKAFCIKGSLRKYFIRYSCLIKWGSCVRDNIKNRLGNILKQVSYLGISKQQIFTWFIQLGKEVNDLVGTKSEKHDILCWSDIYSDDTGIAEEDYNVVPIAHSHVLCWQLSLENVHYLILVLQCFDGVSEKNERWSQGEALNNPRFTELIITRYPKLVTISR